MSPLLPSSRQSAGVISRIFGGDRKDASGAMLGMNAGWSNPNWLQSGLLHGRTGGLPRQLETWIAAYGGTQDSVIWVYACVSLIAAELASYEYKVISPDGDILDPDEIPEDLIGILEQPNREMTYFDFVEFQAMDIELSGNSYWLKDQPTRDGRPLELLRLRPEKVRIAVDNQGRKLGYVYEVDNIMIPYDLDEVIHFKTPSPVGDGLYGMGTVEAIQKSVISDLTQQDHITGFFNNGARISGILTTSEPLGEPQFARLKADFTAAYTGAANAFKVLIAEQGTSYQPLTEAPSGSGVIELRDVAKDEILSGFGVPQFLLGGTGPGGVYKMSEAQHIFSRAMVPRAHRFMERMQADLTSYWGLGFEVDVTITEPLEQKLENATAALGKGASLNQLLDMQGFPTIDDPNADKPLLQAGLSFFDQMVTTAQQAAAMGGGGGFGGGFDGGFGTDTGGGGSFGGGGLGTGTGPGGAPNGAGPAGDLGDGTDTYDPLAAFAANYRGLPAAQTKQILAPRPFSKNRRGAKQVKPETLQIESAEAKARNQRPKLPPGFEDRGDEQPKHAHPASADGVLALQADIFRAAVPDIQKAIQKFFIEQRKRVIASLGRKGVIEKYAPPGSSKPTFKQIDTSRLWDDDAENEALREAYMPLVEEYAKRVFDGMGKVLGSELSWSLTNPYVKQFLDAIGKLITRVNDTTRQKVAEQVETGMQRGYSVTQIANGFPSENYPGIMGVFDDATAARAETIARTETALVYNGAAIASYETADIPTVEVIDGTGDDECRKANGQVWTLAKAMEHRIAHPNCVRSFVPIVAKGTVVALPLEEKRDPDHTWLLARISETPITPERKFVGDLDVKRPVPEFNERLHPRYPPGTPKAGQFMNKPDAIRFLAGLARTGTASNAQRGYLARLEGGGQGARAEARVTQAVSTPRLGSVEDLNAVGIPNEVINQIESRGLDNELKYRKKGKLARRLLGKHEDTKQLHTDPSTGAYSAERKKLHDAMVDLFLREKKPILNDKGFVEWVPDPNGEYVSSPDQTLKRLRDMRKKYARLASHDNDPNSENNMIVKHLDEKIAGHRGDKRALFLAGGNASGKSTALYSPENDGLLKPDATNVEINFDLIKERMPEFAALARSHDIYGTDATHFESADIANRLLDEANRRGVNVIIDASGNSTGDAFQKQIEKHHDLGYRTDVLMVDAPVDVALRDSVGRALKTGRYIPSPILRRVHMHSVKNHVKWAKSPKVDSWQLYRRDDEGVVKAAEGGGGTTRVLSQEHYDAVLSKARGATGRLAGDIGTLKTIQQVAADLKTVQEVQGYIRHGHRVRPYTRVVDDVSVKHGPPVRREIIEIIHRLGLNTKSVKPVRGSVAKELFGEDDDSMSTYRLPDGSWTPARAALHEKILNSFLEGKPSQPVGQRRALFTSGGTASGKSSAIRADPTLEPADPVRIDPDAIKQMLPEWDMLTGGDEPDPSAAFLLHEESSYLGKELQRRAMEHGANLVVDGTGDSKPGKFTGKLRAAHEHNYRVEVLFVDIPTNEAINRSVTRGLEERRFVPIPMVKSTHKGATARIKEWMEIPFIERWTIYDNTERTPRLVATGAHGKGVIHNEDLMGQILDKPNE